MRFTYNNTCNVTIEHNINMYSKEYTIMLKPSGRLDIYIHAENLYKNAPRSCLQCQSWYQIQYTMKSRFGRLWGTTRALAIYTRIAVRHCLVVYQPSVMPSRPRAYYSSSFTGLYQGRVARTPRSCDWQKRCTTLF
jgi:hypothetical protein